MHQGHHGANHPVKDFTTGKVEIISMNHGFAVDRDSLPKGVTETHVSLFDGSNAGIAVEGKPVFPSNTTLKRPPAPRTATIVQAVRRRNGKSKTLISNHLSMVGLDPTTQTLPHTQNSKQPNEPDHWVVGSSPTMERFVQTKINLAEKLTSFSDYFSPRTIAQYNNSDIMVVKAKGDFPWHKHDETDDFFLVLKGALDYPTQG